MLRTARARTALLAALAAGFLARSHAARADEPATVQIVVDPCNAGAFDRDIFTRAAEIELRGDGVERVIVVAARAAGKPEPTMATVTLSALPCSADAKEVEMALDDVTTSKSVRRRLTLGDVPVTARPRVLALAVAELLHASWSELRLPRAPPPPVTLPPSVRLAIFEPTPASPPPAQAPTHRPTDPNLHADLMIEGRSFPNYGSAVVGPNVAASVRPSASFPVRMRLDLRALFGTSYDPLGSISTRLLGGGVAAVLARTAGPIDVEIGPHLGLGWGSVSGHAAGTNIEASSGGGAVLDASALFLVRVALGGSFWATLAVDVGAVIVPVDGQSADRRAAGFGGPMAGAAVGAGRSFF